ncbi:MAG: hypothetical protein ACETWM_20715 [Candidatus Lokiarchaeia archaeon]
MLRFHQPRHPGDAQDAATRARKTGCSSTGEAAAQSGLIYFFSSWIALLRYLTLVFIMANVSP